LLDVRYTAGGYRKIMLHSQPSAMLAPVRLPNDPKLIGRPHYLLCFLLSISDLGSVCAGFRYFASAVIPSLLFSSLHEHCNTNEIR
jgi:hypothetical protein